MDPVLCHFMEGRQRDTISDHGAVINANPVSLGHQSLWVWAGRCSVTTQDYLALCGVSEVAEQKQEQWHCSNPQLGVRDKSTGWWQPVHGLR